MTLSVVLAEDSYLMREGVRRLIETDPHIELLASSHDLQSLEAAVETNAPDVVVTDIRMPPTNTDEGIQAAERLRDSHPTLGVVVLSQYDEPEYALKLLSRGAAGRAYLLKDRLFDATDLLHALPDHQHATRLIAVLIGVSRVGRTTHLISGRTNALHRKARQCLGQLLCQFSRRCLVLLEPSLRPINEHPIHRC